MFITGLVIALAPSCDGTDGESASSTSAASSPDESLVIIDQVAADEITVGVLRVCALLGLADVDSAEVELESLTARFPDSFYVQQLSDSFAQHGVEASQQPPCPE